MGKILFLLFIVFSSVSIKAQDKTTLQKTADTICNCMNKVKINDSSDINEMKTVFMNCFISDGMASLIQLAEEKQIDIADEKAMEGLGTEVGKELMKQKCEPFLKFSLANAKKDFEEDEESIHKIEGSLFRVDNKDFTYLIIKDKAGREHSFIWLDYFEGSDALIGDRVKDFIGKKLILNWKEKEVYLPTAKGYFMIKQIAGITLLK